MLKKILSLTLCLCICLGVVFSATSCGSKEDTTSNTGSTDAVPTTLSFLGVTSEVTSQENVQMVEDALNDIFSARYKTKIDLTLVTENEYMDLIKERVEQAEYWKKYDESIAQYNAYIKTKANQTGTGIDKIFGNWIANEVVVSLETLATRLIYVSEQTTVYEDGRVETLYPEATPIDIVMILDEEMYDEFSDMGLLRSNIDPNYASYKTLQKYIYPTFFTELNNLKGTINAIPNNNLLAESTYLVVNKEVADIAKFDIDTFKGYGDLVGVLAAAKAQGKYAPFKEVPEALGVFKLFSEDVAIGAYFDPMVGYNPSEGEEYAGYDIKNLFEIPEYVNHLELMETYTKEGYFSKEHMANGYAVQVVKGDASVYEKYAAKDSEYYVKEIQIPFVLREAIFDGMLAPTSYTESPERAMEIITAINTDPEVKNLLQYGIYEYNYIKNEEDGTVIRLNSEYMMENAYTGNVYMGLLEFDMGETSWAYVKQTNLASAASPFLTFPVDEKYLQSNLTKILQDAALAEALYTGIKITFDEYRNASGSTLVSYNGMLKNAYKDYFLKRLVADSKATADTAESVFLGSSVAISWYEEQIANKIISEKYDYIRTLEETDVLVGSKLSAGIVSYDDYEKARTKAQDYIEQIESLKVITRITLFDNLSEAEYNERYGKLDLASFETAVYNYIRDNFIKENNITDEDYEKLVQDFIAVEFKFVNANKVEYTYTWEDFEKIKVNAKKFSEALDKARTEYAEMLANEGIKEETINSKTDEELVQVILDTIRMNYYRSKNYTPEAFKANIYNSVVLKKYNYTYEEFNKLKNTDNEKYKSLLKTIKKDYKKQLLEMYTKEEYELLADNKAFAALADYYIEYYSKAEASLRDVMGLSKTEYKDLYYHACEYIKCVEKIKKSFIYTLRTMYDDAYINSLSIEELEEVVYGAVYNSGYYMSQVAQCIGTDLSTYNSSKGDAAAYLKYLDTIVETYKTKLQAKGYDLTELKSYSPNKIEEIVREIIREEQFSNYKTIDVVIAEMCKDRLAGVETTYTNIGDYCKKQAAELSDNYLFKALVTYLNNDLQAQLEANNAK